jgi:lysozyme family protein
MSSADTVVVIYGVHRKTWRGYGRAVEESVVAYFTTEAAATRYVEEYVLVGTGKVIPIRVYSSSRAAAEDESRLA